ncbi:DUF1194 domain-containing protein [Thalassococcus profundi]
MVRLLCLLTMLWAAPAAAQTPCRLALLLALDVSSSVDAEEHELQKAGIAASLNDPDIRHAILNGGPGTVALAVYEWSGRRQSAVVQDWTLLTDAGAIERAAGQIMGTARSETRFPTAMGYALGFGATMLRRAPDCTRRVIDVSGDGITNDGFGPELAYRHFPFDGVTVNGLAVLGADPQVQDYYQDFVRHGPGAFVETAEGYAGFRRAMTRKLFREINDMQVGGRALPHADRPG